jgi:hypothetical protein
MGNKTAKDAYDASKKVVPEESPVEAVERILSNTKSAAILNGVRSASIQTDILEKRKQAILEHLVKADKAFKNYKMSSIPFFFIGYEAHSLKNYDDMDETADIRTGAALWMLEELNKSGELDSAAELLPDASGSFIDMPDIVSPAYGSDLIEEMVLTMPESLMTQNFPEVFAEVVRKIRPESVQKAAERFKRLQWEIVSKHMKCSSVLEKQVMSLSKGTDVENAPCSRMLQNKYYKALEKVHKIASVQKTLDARTGDLLCMSKGETYQLLGVEELTEILAGFKVENPYEVCFALVYLLANGDSAPWLLTSGVALMECVMRILPWAVRYNEGTDLTDSDYNFNGWLNRDPEKDDLNLFNTMVGKRNLAQVLYLWGHCVTPVNLHPFAEEKKELIKCGIDEK